jgi:sporulation protein YlmC with PRC-barrel domain
MIKFDKRNYRKHNDRNKELIKKSLEECGAGRSIVIDNDDEIIAGNGIYEQAQALNIPVKVIETDGSELVVVKRTDLNTDDEKRKKLAVMDNSTSDSSEFDLELLSVDFEVPELKDMGIDVPDFNMFEVGQEQNFDDIVEKQKEPKLCPHCGLPIDD